MNRSIVISAAEYRSRRIRPDAKSAVTTQVNRGKRARTRIRPIRFLSAVPAVAAGTGFALSADLRSDWLAGLAQPVFSPPFAAVCAAYAAALLLFCFVLACALPTGGVLLRFEYGFQTALQMLAPLFFFRLRAVFAALVILVLMGVHQFFLIRFSARCVGKKALLLLPLLLLTAFCAVLLEAILLLN